MSLYDMKREEALEEQAAIRFSQTTLRELIEMEQGLINVAAKVMHGVLKGIEELALYRVDDIVPLAMDRVNEMNAKSKLRRYCEANPEEAAKNMGVLAERFMSIQKVIRGQYFSHAFATAVALHVIRKDLFSVVAPVLHEAAPELLEADNEEKLFCAVDRMMDKLGERFTEKSANAEDKQSKAI